MKKGARSVSFHFNLFCLTLELQYQQNSHFNIFHQGKTKIFARERELRSNSKLAEPFRTLTLLDNICGENQRCMSGGRA